ncbi:hypothetical protein LIER_22765 [Lithospermum erythrorhizon]|uniref:Uncharacterized protein n=1 Tax=Lithospermum erythrorhizon TaxID=34254 RepID=A0AAV3QY53_LITER
MAVGVPPPLPTTPNNIFSSIDMSTNSFKLLIIQRQPFLTNPFFEQPLSSANLKNPQLSTCPICSFPPRCHLSRS